MGLVFCFMAGVWLRWSAIACCMSRGWVRASRWLGGRPALAIPMIMGATTCPPWRMGLLAMASGVCAMPLVLATWRTLVRPTGGTRGADPDHPTVWSVRMDGDEVVFQPFRKLVGPLRGSVPRYYGPGWRRLARYGDLTHGYDIRERRDGARRTIVVVWKAGGLGVVIRFNGGVCTGDRPATLMDSPDSPYSEPTRVTLPDVADTDIPAVADAVMTRYAALIVHMECRVVERSLIPMLAWFRLTWRCEPLHRIMAHAGYDPTVAALGWLDDITAADAEYARVRREYKPTAWIRPILDATGRVIRTLQGKPETADGRHATTDTTPHDTQSRRTGHDQN